MPISLIRSTKDDVIHGSDNDRRTGCGIRFQGVNTYSKAGEMKDITDMTCDKCKEIYATKLIRESNREEQRIEKEERKKFARAKKQGIVTEKSFEEYKANREFEASSKREASKLSNSANSALPPLKADLPQYIPGEGYKSAPASPQDSSSVSVQSAPAAAPVYQAQQASTVSAAPSYEEYISAVKSDPSVSNVSSDIKNPDHSLNASDDDFLNQFMIKPQPSEQAQNPAPSAPDMSENIINAADDILPTIHNEFDDSVIVPPPSNKTSYASPLEEAASKLRNTLTNTFGAQDIDNVSDINSPSLDSFDMGSIDTQNISVQSMQQDFTEPHKNLYNPYAQTPVHNSVTESNDVGDIISSIDKFAYSTASAGTSLNNLPSESASLDKTSSVSGFGADLDISGLDLDAALNTLDSEEKSQTLDGIPGMDINNGQSAFDNHMPQPQQFNPYQQPFNSSFSGIPQPDMSAQVPVSQQFPQQLQYGQPSVQSSHFGQPVAANQFSEPDMQPVSQFTQSVVPPTQYGQSVVSPPQFSDRSAQASVQFGQSSAGVPQFTQNTVQPPQYVPQPNMYGSADSMQQFSNGYVQSTPPQFNGYQNNVKPPFESVNGFAPQQPSSHMPYNAPVQAPDAFKTQPRKSAVTPVFDSSDNINAKPPGFFSPMTQSIMVDSIEDALRQLGSSEVSESSNSKENKKDEVVPDYVPYVPSSSKTLYKNPPPADLKTNAPKKQVSAKEAKKLAKIDAKFHKQLAEQGFNVPEIKNQRRGK